jgi:membrane protease YdiL (CAAX protease family)
MESPEEQLPIAGRHCIHCDLLIAEEAMFCNHCGLLQDVPDIEDAERRQNRLFLLAVFFGIHLTVCLISNFSPAAHSLIPLFVFDGVLSVVTIIYAIILRKELLHLFHWAHFSVLKVLVYGSAAIAAAVLVNVSVKWLNRTIFDSESYYYYAFSHLKYAKLVTVLMVGLQPAIFEELAFRGVLQQGLNKVVDTKQAIFISAFLFALLHMSFISFFWLLPFALCLGYIRMKEDTLWYGVIIHFCFNTTACFLEFFELNLF